MRLGVLFALIAICIALSQTRLDYYYYSDDEQDGEQFDPMAELERYEAEDEYFDEEGSADFGFNPYQRPGLQPDFEQAVAVNSLKIQNVIVLNPSQNAMIMNLNQTVIMIILSQISRNLVTRSLRFAWT